MNLSLDTESDVKLDQCSHQSEDICPLDMRCLLVFDEHDYNHFSRGHKKYSRLPLGKSYLSIYALDRKEKNIPQLGQKHNV